MAATPFDLQDLRRGLDAIDNGLHDLLIERAEIVSRVADHKRLNNVTFYQPGREAEIIRRLVGRHHGRLPVASLVRMWREMLAATVSLEAPFAVAVYAPTGAPGFWDLARDHYGSNTPLSAFGSIGQVIRAVAEGQASAGVLPMPQEGETDPWWRHLLSQDRKTPRVIARLPFGPRGNARTAGADALVVGHGAQQRTSSDRTLIATETAEMSRARIFGLLAALDLRCTFFASCDQIDGAVDLIELDSFVPLADPRIESFRAQLGTALHRLLPLGGYAVPLPIAPPSQASPAAAVPAAGAAGGGAK
jgi:chorismate mutase / prephenate dehydratase